MIVTVPMAVTDEELEQIGDANPGWRVEFIDGSVIMSPTNFDAGVRNADLIAMMSSWAKTHGYVVADSSTGFKISPKNTLSPDCALVRRERWEALTTREQRSFGPVPDIVFELVSAPGEERAEHRKCDRWFAFGVGFVIALNPYAKRRKVRSWGTAPDDFPTDWRSIVD